MQSENGIIYTYQSTYAIRKRHIVAVLHRAPDKLRICVFYAIKTSKNACIIRSECTHYAYKLLCKQTFQIRSVLVPVNDNTVVYINNTFLSEKFPVITSIYTFRRRERIQPRGTECLPF